YERLRSYFLEEYQETNIPANISETIKTDNRIYFKFLYALEGNIPELENCKSEYLTGYAKVGDVILEAKNTIRIVIDGTSDGKNLIGIGLVDEPVEDQGYKLTPRQGCYDFYVTQRWGKLSAGCEGEYERKYESEIEDLVGCGDGTIINSIGEAVDVAGFAIDGVEALAGAAGNLKYPRKSKVCMTLNPQLSYLKIPMNKAKRGGGMRVKRILMYDKGIETGDAAIYGQVYRYELE